MLDALKKHSAKETGQVYDRFLEFARKHLPSEKCEKCLVIWKSDEGKDHSGVTAKTSEVSSLRRALRRLDAEKEIPPQKGKSSEELRNHYTEVRSTLHDCGNDITLPFSFLFRGLGVTSDQFTQEEFTATSLSCIRAYYHGKRELMVIHIPHCMVHGIVVHPKQVGQEANRDSEILLLHPRLRECSAEENGALKTFFMSQETNKSVTKECNITFWTYEGCARWEYRVDLVNKTLAFVKDNRNNLFSCEHNQEWKCTRASNNTPFSNESRECTRTPDDKWTCLTTIERDRRYETRNIITDANERVWFDYTYDIDDAAIRAQTETRRELKAGQRVKLKNMNSDTTLNGLSAYIIYADAATEYVDVITTPNKGKPIRVNKSKCEPMPWKAFQFYPKSFFQAFPLGTPVPSGLSFDMNLAGRQYNLYKSLS